MKDFSPGASGNAVISTGCVAYPVDTYHHGGERLS
jgi:hypothetical protein